MTIVGETGSGKSLLVQALMGTLPPALRAFGKALIDGAAFDLSQPALMRKLWGRTIAVLPQEPWLALDPLMQARSQVAEVHQFVGGERNSQDLAGRELAGLGLGQAVNRLPGELSGGMAQRLAISAARAAGGHIQFADEPTKGLDSAMRDKVAALLLDRTGNEGGLLTVTHDLDLARLLGGDMMVMLEGKVVETGVAEDLLTDPQHEYTRRLIAAQPSNWEARNSTSSASSPVLTASGIAAERGGSVLFRDIDLTFHSGDIVGVYGPSGCGKTSLGNALLGLLPLSAGKVGRVANLDRTRYQKLWQDPPSAFARRFSIGAELDAVAKLHGVTRERMDRLRAKLRLPATLLSRLPAEVSGGELQRFALMRALMVDPVFLFADEPTSRLDPITQHEVFTLLGDVVRAENMAILVVSHERELLDRFCDRVIALGAA